MSLLLDFTTLSDSLQLLIEIEAAEDWSSPLTPRSVVAKLD